MTMDSQHMDSNGHGTGARAPRRVGAGIRVAVHGASPAIARSLAHRFVSAGSQVTLIDSELRKAEKAFHEVASRLQQGSDSPGQEDLSQRIQIGADLEKLRQQSVIFHVPSRQDSIDVIRRDIQLMESMLSAETPVLTLVHNSEIAAALTPHVEANARLMALHVPLPRFPVPFAQLIHGQAPSHAALASARTALNAIALTPVETSHALGGLLLDRHFIPVLQEACRMLRSSEASIESLDRGFPTPWLMHLGPFQAADLLGIDHVVATCQALVSLTGNERFAADPLLKSLEERGHLGWKSGRGFYDYALED